jgi:predicted transcriptional regulator
MITFTPYHRPLAERQEGRSTVVSFPVAAATDRVVQIGPLELAILGYLWRSGAPRTAWQVHRALEDRRQIVENTVTVTLLRMARTGYVEALPAEGQTKILRGRPSRYRAAISREALAATVVAAVWEA